jgi:peptidoglycan-N-acetylglucosamine deacetylase
MRVTPFFVWIVSFCGVNCALFALPQYGYSLGCLVLLHFGIFAWGITSLRSQFFGRVYFRGKKNDRRIAITFDDGPDAGLTGEVLDMLDRYAMRATFFVVGCHVRRYPQIIKRAFRTGHVIACHDLNHRWWSNFRMTSMLFRDIIEARRIIEGVIGKKPLIYRPPMGLMNPHVPIALSRLNMVCVGWNERLRDSGNRRAKNLLKMPRLGKPGAVIMLHDCLPKPKNKKIFLEQFEKMLKKIQEKGLQTVGVDELLGLQAYEGILVTDKS